MYGQLKVGLLSRLYQPLRSFKLAKKRLSMCWCSLRHSFWISVEDYCGIKMYATLHHSLYNSRACNKLQNQNTVSSSGDHGLCTAHRYFDYCQREYLLTMCKTSDSYYYVHVELEILD